MGGRGAESAPVAQAGGVGQQVVAGDRRFAGDSRVIVGSPSRHEDAHVLLLPLVSEVPTPGNVDP